MVEQEPSAAPSPPVSEPSRRAEDAGVAGEWERQFIDDLVAANRLKTYLVSQGVDVSTEVLQGLAGLSELFQSQIGDFIQKEREDWVLRAPLRWFFRDGAP